MFAPLQDEISTLGNFGPKKYTIFVSKNKKWIIDKARELKGNYKNQNNPCGVEDPSNNLDEFKNVPGIDLGPIKDGRK